MVAIETGSRRVTRAAPVVTNIESLRRVRSPFPDMRTPRLPCPKTAGYRRRRAVWWRHGTERPAALHRADGARFAVRWRVLRRRHVDRHLLPADLSGAARRSAELPLLRHAAAGRARGIPPLPPLPARTGARQRAGRRRATHCAADRAARSRKDRLDEKAGLEAIAEPVRAQLAADSAHRPEGARRATDPAPADAPPAAGETAPDGDRAADHRRRLCQRVLEPAAVQRRLRPALRDAADAAAPEGVRRWRPDGRRADADAAARIPPAVRLEGHSRLSRRPCPHGSSTSRQRPTPGP